MKYVIKKVFLYLVLFGILSACLRDDLVPPNARTVTISAGINTDTKVSILPQSGVWKFLWTDGDMLGGYSSDDPQRQIRFVEFLPTTDLKAKDLSSVAFSGLVGGYNLRLVYPYIETQISNGVVALDYTKQAVDLEEPFYQLGKKISLISDRTISTEEESNTNMVHLGSVLNFQINLTGLGTASESEITRIEITNLASITDLNLEAPDFTNPLSNTQKQVIDLQVDHISPLQESITYSMPVATFPFELIQSDVIGLKVYYIVDSQYYIKEFQKVMTQDFSIKEGLYYTVPLELDLSGGELVTPQFSLESISPTNLPEENTWAITNEAVTTGVRDVARVQEDPNSQGEFYNLYQALVAASLDSREITLDFPNLKTFPAGAFFDMANLASGSKTNEPLSRASNNTLKNPLTSLVSVNAPMVENVGDYAFVNNAGLKEINLPKATSVAYGAFSYLLGLEELEISTQSELLSFEDDTFLGTALSNIDLITGENNGTTTNGTIWYVPSPDPLSQDRKLTLGPFKSINGLTSPPVYPEFRYGWYEVLVNKSENFNFTEVAPVEYNIEFVRDSSGDDLKVWISNIAGEDTGAGFYGILNETHSELTIPLGQISTTNTTTYGDGKMYLYGIDVSGAVYRDGEISAPIGSDGTISFYDYAFMISQGGVGSYNIYYPSYIASVYVPYESTDFSKHGEVSILQRATVGSGVDFVIMGDGYVDRDMVPGGKYDQIMNETMENLFLVEPLKSYRNYFNVYAIKLVSKNEGVISGNETALKTWFGDGTSIGGEDATAFNIARKIPGFDRASTPITVVVNSSKYAGTCYTYSDGASIGYNPYQGGGYPFQQIINHEMVGHGFGRLLDEYRYYYTPINTTFVSNFNRSRNVFNMGYNLTIDKTDVPWDHFFELNDPRYTDIVVPELFEGGYFFTQGVWRAEYNHCMNNNILYFNGPSRELMVKRIYETIGETYTFDAFLALDKYEPVTGSTPTTGLLPRVDIQYHPPVLLDGSPEDPQNRMEIRRELTRSLKRMK